MHDPGIEVLQLSVIGCPGETDVGFALRVTGGGEVTFTVTDAVPPWPPAPPHCKLNVVGTVRLLMACEPLVATPELHWLLAGFADSMHPPCPWIEAVQLNVTGCPYAMDVELALSVTVGIGVGVGVGVGVGGGGGVTGTVMDAEPLWPPGPVQVILNVVVAVRLLIYAPPEKAWPTIRVPGTHITFAGLAELVHVACIEML